MSPDVAGSTSGDSRHASRRLAGNQVTADMLAVAWLDIRYSRLACLAWLDIR